MSDTPNPEHQAEPAPVAEADGAAAAGNTAGEAPEPAGPAPAGADDPAPADAAAKPAAAVADEDAAPWYQALPARHHRSVAKFKGVADLAAGYADLERRLGQALFPPPADAGPAALARFQERLGRPKTSEGYRPPAAPPGTALDADKLALFRDKAFEIGLPQAQFEALVSWELESQQALQAEAALRHDQAHQALEAAWGAAAPAHYEKARRVAGILFDDAERQALELDGAPRDWAAPLVAALARVSPSFEEHRFHGRAERDLGRSTQGLIDDLNGLMAEPDYWQDEAKQRRAREINEQLYGTRSIHPAG